MDTPTHSSYFCVSGNILNEGMEILNESDYQEVYCETTSLRMAVGRDMNDDNSHANIKEKATKDLGEKN